MMNSLDEVLPDEGAARGQENKMDDLHYTWAGATRGAPRSGPARQGDEVKGLLQAPPPLVRTQSEAVENL